MNTFSTFEAKNKLSELLAAAAKGAPQVITKNGVETAVIISYAEFRKLKARESSFADFLLDSPLRESDVNLTRSEDAARSTINFAEDFADQV